MSEEPGGPEAAHPNRYLGDGVTASFDGYQVWVSTPRGHETHSVALEPPVFRELVAWVKTLGPEAARAFGLK